jgi:S1-C subfamily serine protease
MTARVLARTFAVAAMVAVAGCGGGGSSNGGGGGSTQGATPDTTTVQIAASPSAGSFDPQAIYKQTAPSVVTVISIFNGSGIDTLLGGGGGGQAAEGSGFVVSDSGEIATNAHVVTTGQAPSISKAAQVYVQFADGNRVAANIVGFDPNADVALLRIDPSDLRGLKLHALQFGDAQGATVGEPVAAIGSPFGEEQSLSVGVVSAKNRSIDSLTGFSISGALQTDAAINHGNSGGPLLDAHGRVLGINSQIKSSGGGGEGVGFAVPSDLVQHSLAQLRASGRARYAYLGVSTADVYPQLAGHFKLGADHGAWIQSVVPGGPGEQAGLRAGTSSEQRFQAQAYRPGGDVIVQVGATKVSGPDALGRILDAYRPGQKVTLTIERDGRQRTIDVTLGERPANVRP